MAVDVETLRDRLDAARLELTTADEKMKGEDFDGARRAINRIRGFMEDALELLDEDSEPR